MTEIIWAGIGMFIGWLLYGTGAGHPAAAASTAATSAKTAVHQAVAQASSSVMSVIWDVALHAAVILVLLVILGLAVRYGVPAVWRRAGLSVSISRHGRGRA